MTLTNTYLKSITVIGLMLLTINGSFAQEKEKSQAFFGYFLWYDGTIGDRPIKAKIGVNNGEYDVYYSYNDHKKWVHLINSKVIYNTIYARADVDEKSYDGFVKLQLDNLWNPKGQWTSPTGEKLPIELKSTLTYPPFGEVKSTLKNELVPLLLNPKIAVDSVEITYIEISNGKTNTIRQLHTHDSAKLDNTQMVYVDINYDGFLDLVIDDSFFLYNALEQAFIKDENDSVGSFFPGIGHIGVYNPYNHSFFSSHFRTVMQYRSKNGEIAVYEREEYIEYNDSPYIVVSENKLRYIDGKEMYSYLDIYLKEDTARMVFALVEDSIGDAPIMNGAELILRDPAGEINHYTYDKGKWKSIFIELNH